MSKQFKPIKEFINYEICDEGYVISNKPSGRLKLKPHITNSGYLRINLSKGSVYVHRSIHRLVAEYFIPNPHKRTEVNHKDGNKTNNHAANLEWVTRKQNVLHSFKEGNRKVLFGDRFKTPKLTEDLVRQIRIKHREGKTISSMSRYYTVSRSTISNVVRGIYWRHVV